MQYTVCELIYSGCFNQGFIFNKFARMYDISLIVAPNLSMGINYQMKIGDVSSISIEQGRVSAKFVEAPGDIPHLIRNTQYRGVSPFLRRCDPFPLTNKFAPAF